MHNFTKDTIISLFLNKRNLTDEDLRKIKQPMFSDVHSGALLKDAMMFCTILNDVRNEPIAIIPDYDADGVGSGITLLAGLEIIGVQHTPYLYPPRTNTGYGMSIKAVDEILENAPMTKVIITTDNGIKAYDGIAYAKSKGLTVLVSDHHMGSDLEPNADVIVNPNRVNDPYPFKSISGTVVIWKLLVLYAQTYLTEAQLQMMYNLIVFAGITTISDVMTMLDENRYIVKVMINMLTMPGYLRSQVDYGGYSSYGNAFRGVWAMMQVLEANKKLSNGIDEDTVGFYMAPILNSPRRMTGSSALSFDLFQAQSDDEAMILANALFDLNEDRKHEVNGITNEIVATVKNGSPADALVTVANTRGGFAGLISGKLTNMLNLPTIVFSHVDRTSDDAIIPEASIAAYAAKQGVLHGSGRSPQWFHLLNVLTEISELDPNIFASFGGHAAAVGVGVNASHYPLFVELFTRFVVEALSEANMDTDVAEDCHVDSSSIALAFEGYTPKYTPDVLVTTDDDLTELIDTVRFFDSLRPFGEGFRQPTFSTILPSSLFSVSFMGSDKQHVKFVLPNGFTIIQWNCSDSLKDRTDNYMIKVVGKLSVNSFRGRNTVQLIADDIITIP